MILSIAGPAFSASVESKPSSFADVASFKSWKLARGTIADGPILQSKDGKDLELISPTCIELPAVVTFQFRVAQGDSFSCGVAQAGQDEKCFFESRMTMTAANVAMITVASQGEAIATALPSTGLTYLGNKKKKPTALQYGWRFPVIKNLWDENDRSEIGSAYASLNPFEEKIFVMRLMITATSCQAWLDDRLIWEQRTACQKQLYFTVKLSKTAKLLSVNFTVPAEHDRFLPLSLDHYSHKKTTQEKAAQTQLVSLDQVPMWVTKNPNVDIDLGDSLYRYRMTHGSGPDVGNVNAICNWRGAFVVDPASLEFRVPYRNYQNVWLLAWCDEKPNAISKGTLRFFRQQAGYPASTDFEISEQAIQQGLVKKLPQQSVNGHPLYLICVPVDTENFYGFHDLADYYLEFEISKPTALMRSYPDPIYYASHPAGLPSSIHVVGITLQTAPIDYEIRPLQCGHVFERPEKPGYRVTVKNTTQQAFEAHVTLSTKSFDGDEEKTVTAPAKIEAGKSGDVTLDFDLQKNGWHEVKVRIEAGGVTQQNTLSLVMLPPNTRSYGNAPNETRFGLWDLWSHYTPLPSDDLLAMFRRLGLRRIDNASYLDEVCSASLMKRHNFLPTSLHTINGTLQNLNENDPAAMKEMVSKELAHVGFVAKEFDAAHYFFGGEWSISKEVDHAPWPLYTGDGDRELTAAEKAKTERYTKIFSTAGSAIREKFPNVKLVLQWGAPNNTLAFLRQGFPKNLVDGFGMDAPQFELLPEISNVAGSINNLWQLREVAKSLGWPRLPIHWVEGPFFPTNPGALTESEQAEYQIRYWLMGFAYGIDQFESGVIPHDGANFYGAEHYGAGVFHRIPFENPKPAVAAIATATAMLCGADPIGGIDTGCLTTYCMAFERNKTHEKFFALWRVTGKVDATLKVHGSNPVLTDTMGNATPLTIRDGAIHLTLSSSPLWLTGIDQIENFIFALPKYDSTPAKISRRLTDMSSQHWEYDAAEDVSYANNHFAMRRISDSNLRAEFGQGESGHTDAVAITLLQEPGDRPLATRYGTLKLKAPETIPGKASALGIWIKGNASWGRVVYQLRDAKGEIWTSIGTKNDWNCDDPHGWSYITFEGWRYVRFPLPGNKPFDSARDLESTWWGSRDGDGIVDLPLTLEKVFVEARNEVPYLSQLKLVPERSYKLSQLTVEYENESDTTPAAIAQNQIRKTLPQWNGMLENPIAQLAAKGVGAAPQIKGFDEPAHWNDGRRMHVRFDQDKALKYNLYLSRMADGRGAELLLSGVEDNKIVRGFRPEIKVYLFLTSIGPDKKESKPSKPFELITHDNFREK